MSALFRNPLIRLLGQLWWFPILALMIIGFGMVGGFAVPLTLLLIFMAVAFVFGLLLAPRIDGLRKSWQLKSERISVEHRFLCPACLNFGSFDYACEECKVRVEPFIVHTDGAYVTKCGHCHNALFNEEDPEGNAIVARCVRCEVVCNCEVYHNRAVKTLATLTSKDFIALAESAGLELRVSEDNILFAIHDDGETLAVILNLGDLNELLVPDSMMHALRDISRIWIDCAGTDPLALGQAVDAMIMNTEFPEERWRAVTVCAHQSVIDPASRHVLETRFGNLVFGVSIDDFIGGRRPRFKAASGDRLTAARF